MPNRLPVFANQRIRLLTRLHWLLGVLFSFGLLLAGVAYQTAFAQEIDSLRKGVVKIIANQNGIQTTGTGFIIKQDAKATYIVTAAHVVSGDKFPQVAFFSERHSLIEAEVLQNDLRYDISLLKVRDPSQVPADGVTLMFSVKDNVKDSDALITIGFPPGIEWARIPVTLVSRQGADLILDRNLDEGNSGGPVLKNGRIVGLVTQSDNQFGRAIPEQFITTVLAGWGITLTQREVANGPTTAKPATAARLPIEPDMVVIPAGKFLMGSPENEAGRMDNEGPQHEVTIAAFAISRTEITIGQFKQFMQETHHQTTAETNGEGCVGWDGTQKNWKRDPKYTWQNPGFKQEDNHPVVCVSWQDTQHYLNWLSQRTGVRYRLPSEAEWEYAARAHTISPYFYQPEQQCIYANGAGQETKFIAHSSWVLVPCTDPFVYTAPVARFAENPFGLFDMAGNVWELTQDCWHNDYQGAPGDGSAWLEKQDGDCDRRVVRGGSWDFYPRNLRSAIRGRSNLDEAGYAVGFRVARDF